MSRVNKKRRGQKSPLGGRERAEKNGAAYFRQATFYIRKEQGDFYPLGGSAHCWNFPQQSCVWTKAAVVVKLVLWPCDPLSNLTIRVCLHCSKRRCYCMHWQGEKEKERP